MDNPLFDEIYENRDFYIHGRKFPSFRDMVKLALDRNLDQIGLYYYPSGDPEGDADAHQYIGFKLSQLGTEKGAVSITDIHVSDTHWVLWSRGQTARYSYQEDRWISDCRVDDVYDDGDDQWLSRVLTWVCQQVPVSPEVIEFGEIPVREQLETCRPVLSSP
jgi:hypothetical protein